MTFKKQSVIFYVLLVLCAAGIVLWFSGVFQDWLILFGEKLIGRPLVRDAWYTRFSSMSLSVALFFLTVPLYFFKFDGYFVKEELPSDRKLWEMSFTEHIRSYAAFVRGHLWLFALTIFVLLAAYGPKLFNEVISIDTELHIEQNHWRWTMSIGRFGYSLLQKIFHPFGFNVWVGTYLGFVNLLFGTLAWCHLVILLFPSAKKVPLAVFAVLFASSNVWAAQMYFTLQSAEAMFIVLAAPFAVLGLFSGILCRKYPRVVLSALALSYLVAIYQAPVLLFCAGLLLCFMRYAEEDDGNEKSRWMLALKLTGAVVAVLAVYFVCNKIVLAAFGVHKSDYLESRYLSKLGRLPLNVLMFLISLSRNNPLATAVLLVAFPPYLHIVRHQKSAVRIVAMLLIPALCFVFGVITSDFSFRIEFAMPLALSFMAFFVLARFDGGVRRVSVVVAAVLCFLCVEETAMLNWTELRRHEQDRLVAQDIALRICALGTNEEIRETPVFIYGKYETHLNGAFIRKDMFGKSVFSWQNGKSPNDATGMGIAFMNDVGFAGFDFKKVTTDDMPLVMKARSAAETMPDYPSAGCVQNLGDVIVVRLSETTYQPEE